MVLSILLMAAQAEQTVVRVVEARTATPWVEVFRARCGGQQLEITRPMRPLQAGPQVRLNGRAARGDVRPLELELGETGAAYRMSFQCSQNNEMMHLNWVSGLVGEGGHIRYRAGSAAFHEGALVSSRSEATNEETFWYR